MSIQRVILPVSLAIFLATSTQLLSMDRGAQTIISSGVGYTSIEESELLDFGLGAMFALDRDGIFAVGVSAGWLNDLGDNEEEGYQLGASIIFFPTDKLQLSLGLNYVSTEFDTWASGYTAERDQYYCAWTADSTSIGGNFDIKYRFIPASENISPYLVAGIGVSKPDVKAEDGYTHLTAPRGWYYVRTGNRYNSFDGVNVEYDLDNVFVAKIGAGVDFALTRNVGLNLYCSFGMSQYEHEVRVWDSTYSTSDSTLWGLGASIKWYWGGNKE